MSEVREVLRLQSEDREEVLQLVSQDRLSFVYWYDVGYLIVCVSMIGILNTN